MFLDHEQSYFVQFVKESGVWSRQVSSSNGATTIRSISKWREGGEERERDEWGKNGEMAERRNGGRKVLAAGDEELADGED